MAEKRVLTDEELEEVSGGDMNEVIYAYNQLRHMGVIPSGPHMTLPAVAKMKTVEAVLKLKGIKMEYNPNGNNTYILDLGDGNTQKMSLEQVLEYMDKNRPWNIWI